MVSEYLKTNATLGSAPLIVRTLDSIIRRMSQVRLLRKYLGRPYLFVTIRIWDHMPALLMSWRPVRAYGCHLHNLIQLRASRRQSLGTFFFRNRPELTLLIHLLEQRCEGSSVHLAVLACSKGAEVYSISHAIRCARPDLDLKICALDINEDVLQFAKSGVYSVDDHSALRAQSSGASGQNAAVVMNTFADQNRSIFERMSPEEMEMMFDRKGNEVKVKSQFREGVTWHVGDAGDVPSVLGLQDIVFANRFLCHMNPDEAERCLRNLARLVRPGGYLFVSGVDLTVRTNVARDLGWKPVTDLIGEIHEGDPSLRRDWPLHYWALEPLDQRRIDWQMRYASVFEL